MAYKYNTTTSQINKSNQTLSSIYQKSERALLPIFIFTWKNNKKTCIELQKRVLCEQQDLEGPQQDNQKLGTCVLKPIFDHWFDLFDGVGSITGDSNRIPLISPLKIRAQQRTAVSTVWLLPYAHTWPKDMVLVSTPNTSYTVQDYQRFFKDINYKDGWAMRQDTEPLVSALKPPGVPVHCLYGSGIPTPQQYNYTNFPDVDPTVINGDGDGTVNLLSATQCKRWIGQQKQPVNMFELPGNEHVAMLLNITTVNYIKNVLFPPWWHHTSPV